MASTPRLPLPRLFLRNNNNNSSSRKVPSTSNNNNSNSKSKDNNNNNNKEPSIPAWRRLPKKNKLLFLPRQRRQHERKQSVDTEDSITSECPETVDMIRILPEDTRSLISDLSSAPSSRGNIFNHHHQHQHGDHSHNGWIRRHYYYYNRNNNKTQYQVHQQHHPSVPTPAATTTSKEWILPHGGADAEQVFTTTWDIDFVDDHHCYGRIRYGCSRRLLYQGTNVVSTVQDLIEFDGRAVFSVRPAKTSDPAAKRRIIVPASEIVSTLQDLTA